MAARRIAGVLVIIGLFTANNASAESAECLEDHDCPRGRYCNSKSGILYCEQCVDCSMLNREPSRILCAHSRAECGSCLPGYLDELLTNNRRSDFCQPSPDSSLNKGDDSLITESVNLPNAVVILISALGFVVVAILTALGVYGLQKWKSPAVAPSPPVFQGRRPSVDAESQPCLHLVPIREPPPPYNDVNVQDHEAPSTSTVIVTHGVEVRSEDETKLGAVPFQSPDYDGQRRRLRRSLVSVAVESDDEDVVLVEGALEFEGELELGLGAFNHPSPARSDATEASDWRPGDLSVVQELPVIEEEAEEVEDAVVRELIDDGESGGEVNRPSSEISFPNSPVSSRAAAATDSAFANDDDSRRISAVVEDDLDDEDIEPPDPFLLDRDRDSALGSQHSVASARLQSTTLSSMSSNGLRRSYSNIDMTTRRPSLKRQKSNNDGSFAMAKRAKEEAAEAVTNSEED